MVVVVLVVGTNLYFCRNLPIKANLKTVCRKRLTLELYFRCHSGACYPCNLYQKVSCNCGATSVSVPCGREKTMKPPRCRRECQAPSRCHHPSSDNRHPCHPGPCPPCKQSCGKSLSCGHCCAAPCHENVKVRVEDKNRPAGPWEAKGPQWTIAALPCPPCEAPVEVTCLGGHETTLWPCHSAKPASCGRKCGRQLPCENCTCARDCHRVRGVEDAVKVCRDFFILLAQLRSLIVLLGGDQL